MRQSQLFTKTRKSAPRDEVSKNAELLIRAGFIHKEMAGVYAFLPLGKRVLDNISQIVREEMNRVGGLEVQMTTLQPKEIWEKTDRWDDSKVDNWFKTKLANGTELGVGLTHEEPVVDALSDFISSYKDLPISVYQIQTKFRNELRAKSGLLRGREFLMKDMYTFSRTQEEHDEIYERVAEAYHRVYERLGIGETTYRTYADGGIFTKRFSHEFQTLSDAGEDVIYVDESKKLAINKEIYSDDTLKKIGLEKEGLVERRSVEVGNIFPLESKYTDALDVYYTDKDGQKRSIIAGCYGIGISRLVGTIAELWSDEKGLVWPESISPFRAHLVLVNANDEDQKRLAEDIYEELLAHTIDVLFDDRVAQPGEKFADSDLIGIPHRITVGKISLESGLLEVTDRRSGETRRIEKDKLIEMLRR